MRVRVCERVRVRVRVRARERERETGGERASERERVAVCERESTGGWRPPPEDGQGSHTVGYYSCIKSQLASRYRL